MPGRSQADNTVKGYHFAVLTAKSGERSTIQCSVNRILPTSRLRKKLIDVKYWTMLDLQDPIEQS